MKDKNWEFTGETKDFGDVKLKRIRLTKDCECGEKGTVGGWIEKESNLSGNAFVYDDAMVFGDAVVYGNARVYDDAIIHDNAKVFGDALIEDSSRVYGNACVLDNAWVRDNAWVYGNARVYGDARVYGNAWVNGESMVYGYAIVSGNARVFDDANVHGNAYVYGKARVHDDAIATREVFTSNYARNLTLTDSHISYGGIQKTIKEWEEWLESDEVIETKRDTDKFKLIELELKTAILKSKMQYE